MSKTWLGSSAGLFVLFVMFSEVVTLSISRGFLDVYNADLVQPYLIAHDVIDDFSSLFYWTLSPANFAFPDCLVAVILTILDAPMRSMPILYGAALLTAYALAVGGVTAGLGKSAFTGALLAALSLLSLIGFADVLPSRTVGMALTKSLFASFIHTGALVGGLATMAFVVTIMSEARHHNLLFVVAAVFAALLGFSDLLYLIWFLGPICAVWAGFIMQREGWRIVRPVVLFACGIAGMVTDQLVRTVPSYGDVDTVRSVAVWVASPGRAVSQGDWLMLLAIIGGILLCIASAIRLLRLARGGGVLSKNSAALLMIEVANTAAFVLPAVAGRLPYPDDFRYSMPIFLLPSVWLTVWSIHRIGAIYRLAAVWSVVAFGGLAAMSGEAIAASAEVGTPSHLADCLMNLGQHAGLADYWNAKKLIFETNYRVIVAQVSDIGLPVNWNVNRRWFSLDSPTFILPARLDDSALIERFGAPNARVTCGTDDIWLYDRPIAWPISTPNR